MCLAALVVWMCSVVLCDGSVIEYVCGVCVGGGGALLVCLFLLLLPLNGKSAYSLSLK